MSTEDISQTGPIDANELTIINAETSSRKKENGANEIMRYSSCKSYGTVSPLVCVCRANELIKYGDSQCWSRIILLCMQNVLVQIY